MGVEGASVLNFLERADHGGFRIEVSNSCCCTLGQIMYDAIFAGVLHTLKVYCVRRRSISSLISFCILACFISASSFAALNLAT